jgi:hypothetical protein
VQTHRPTAHRPVTTQPSNLRTLRPANDTKGRTALIVGADYIEPLKKTMEEMGNFRVEHWTGRKSGDLRRSIPKNVDLCIVLCDYVSHGLVRKVREDAKTLGLPVLYCRRSLGEVREKIREYAVAA